MLEEGRTVEIKNNSMSLALRTINKTLHVEWIDTVSGKRFASGPLIFRCTLQSDEKTQETSFLNVIRVEKEGRNSIKIYAANPYLKVEEVLTMKSDPPALEESLKVSSRHLLYPHLLSSHHLYTVDLVTGFTIPLTDNYGQVLPEVSRDRWVAIPHRRDTMVSDNSYQDYGVDDLLKKRPFTPSAFIGSVSPVESFGSEGWAWVRGDKTLTTIRYSQEHMVFSLLGIEYLSEGVYLRFGGSGVWHGDPECLRKIEPHAEIILGTTTHILVDGGWREAYYAFRDFMRKKGNGLRESYNPPVHWNELYDNPLWNLRGKEDSGSPRMRSRYYTVKDMEEEAVKAKELGCEALYLDPGWDTNFGSTIWDEKRLGPQKEFVSLLKKKYGLKLSLHSPLAVWCDPTTYPKDAERLDKDGKRVKGKLCSGARSYLKVKTERLLKLCADGATFLMFDGTAFTGPCFDKDHGHPVPYTKEAQCWYYLRLAQEVHKYYPDVIIEMHDMVIGGSNLRYCPNYYLYGLPGSFDENWAYEYMWDPMDDILSGRALSLYYYNLAYELPMYLHIDLRFDNIHCLEFWWYASTCRHLGVGGKHHSPAVWEAHKSAMKRYLRLKELYVQGRFYGYGEDIHLHVLPEKGWLVVNLFNLTDRRVYKTCAIPRKEIGIPPEDSYIVEHGCNLDREHLYVGKWMEPYSAEVFEVRSAKTDNEKITLSLRMTH